MLESTAIMASCHLSLAAGDKAGSSVVVNPRLSVIAAGEQPTGSIKEPDGFHANTNVALTFLQTK